MAAAPVLDQANAPDPGSVSPLAIGGSSNQLLAQVLTVGLDGRLVDVRAPIGCATGRLIIEIREIAATGEPGTNVIATRSYRPGHFPDFVSTELTSMSFGGRVRITAGDRIAFVLSNPTGSCGIQPGTAGDPYLAGEGWSFDDVNGAWVRLGNFR